jgi:hypothetical protein
MQKALGRTGTRPNATSVVPICYVRFTSICDVEAVATAFRFGSI